MTIELIAENAEQIEEMMRRLYPKAEQFRVVHQRKAERRDIERFYDRLKVQTKRGGFRSNYY